MNRRCRQLLVTVAVVLAMAVMGTMAAWASDDNSLASLGITTEGVSVSPEFRYDIWEYAVEVPADTKVLELEPHTTNPAATVNSVTGTTLDENGNGKVVITVTSESGNAIEYVLNVTRARGAMDPAEAIAANESSAVVTIDTEVMQSEVETEDPRYVKVDRNSLQDAENTIEKLQETITEQRSHISMLTYVLYALIAVSIVFLFIVISQLLRKRDLAQELAYYKQEDPYNRGGSVAEDGWGDWGEDEIDRARRQKRAAEDGDWDEPPASPASGWASQQVGTPVRPQKHSSRNAQNPAYRQDPSQMNQANSRQGRQPQRERQQTGPSDETRRYEVTQPVRPHEVPKDVTKDLSRVNKAEAKAMKKAAAAEAKRAQEEKKAQRARDEEARRQAQEAERIAKEQEAARQAQEAALEKAASLRAKQEAEAGAEDGKNVKINLIDL